MLLFTWADLWLNVSVYVVLTSHRVGIQSSDVLFWVLQIMKRLFYAYNLIILKIGLNFIRLNVEGDAGLLVTQI